MIQPCLLLLRNVRTHVIRVGAVLALAATLALNGQAPVEATSAQVAFSPAAATTGVGGIANVNITVANVTNLGGYDVYLQFNPAVVHLTSLTDTGFIKSGSNIVVCNDATIDNSAGTATDSCATVSPFGPPGPGVSTTTARALMHAQFSGVAIGTSALSLTGTALQDPTGVPIAAMLSSGSVTVTVASVGGISEPPDLQRLPRSSPSSRPSEQPRGFMLLASVALAGLALAYAVRRSIR